MTPRSAEDPAQVVEASVLSQLLLDWDDADFAVLSETMAATSHSPLDSPASASISPSAAVGTDAPGSTTYGLIEPGSATAGLRDPRSRSTLCRKRQREELTRLRSEAATLEKQLQDLRVLTRPTYCADGAASDPHERVWKHHATHQLERRRQAERENAKLRDLIGAQGHVAKRLSKALDHARAINKSCNEALKNAQSLSASGPTGYHVITDHSVFPWRPQIEQQVFHNNAFWMEDLERELVRVTGSASGQTTVECAFTAVLPFDLAATGAALWGHYAANFQALPTGHYKAFAASESLLVAGFDLQLRNSSSRDVPVRSKFLVRRLQNDSERVVGLWEDMSSPVEGHPNEGLVVKINGCVCLDKIQLLSMAESTRIRVYSLQAIVGRTEESIGADELERLLTDAYRGVHRKICRDVEASLVDDSFQRRAGGVQV